ncbi:MAG: transcription-repair coupling factor [Bacteriovoracaceae bacterium]|nr:transcription-repair coupling factor [Bacteriovoracaceae bacterium]
MTLFLSITHKIKNWFNSGTEPLNINGITPSQWIFLFNNFIRDGLGITQKNHLILCPTVELAESIQVSLSKISTEKHVHFYPGLENSPYGKILPSQSDLLQRFKVLDILAQKKTSNVIIMTVEAFLLKMPPCNFFVSKAFDIAVSDIISREELSKKLVGVGYAHTNSTEEPGTFCSKGEIFDIYPISGRPIRIIYYDDMIEHIYHIDLETNKSIRNDNINRIHIAVSPNIFSSEEFTQNLRKYIPIPGPQFKNKFERRKEIFNKLSHNQLFEDFPNFVSLFMEQTTGFEHYLNPNDWIITSVNHNENMDIFTMLLEKLREEFNTSLTEPDNSLLLPSPEKLYSYTFSDSLNNYKSILTNTVEINLDINKILASKIDLAFENTPHFIGKHINQSLGKHEYIKHALEFLRSHFENKGSIVFATFVKETKAEIEYLMDLYEFPQSLRERIFFKNFNLSDGFYYDLENILIISEGDLFGRKQVKSKSNYRKNIDLFAERLATIKPGDYVMHSEHGLGIYRGLQTIAIDSSNTDYLIIEYTEGDKIYVPVYKMNLVQKHADTTANLSPASLRSNKFNQLKNKARNSAKKLAFDLLKLQAERQSHTAFAFSPPDHVFKEFELAFQFTETPDQISAIDNIIESMQKPVPMDYLVCGDVGYGKTEIAMRAAFKAILDDRQVAVLVPTTILALQHHQSFCERFKNFPVNIEFISRFKSAKQIKEIKQNLKEGKIDVIIGTHKLLHESVIFKSLGLVIVDEEQRFGVSHKEKLKLYKATVDFMTLTATPIPRTLQLAFLGLKDLVLIQTPPPKRQSIKTYIVKNDESTIQSAIKKELQRGGQVFFVHNRVKDIEIIYGKLSELVPDASIVIGHGQLPEKILEQRIEAFYSGKFQVLLCTTIIESGLDIPNANTMIINRADTFGLAQLHQLRGRIGRSDRKAYAYFMVPEYHNITVEAERRLKALQTYAEIGAGFSLASCDLEFRGAGDILGSSQSGHIESIGLELYMELLQEAIREIKGERKIINKNIEISTPYPSYIPNNYICDSSARLKYYKKLSNCLEHGPLTNIFDEMCDVYGRPPKELENLFTIIRTRIQVQTIGLRNIKVAGNIISMAFDKNILDNDAILRNKIVETFLKRPKVYQFTRDYKVVYCHKNSVGPADLLEFSKNIAEQILPC